MKLDDVDFPLAPLAGRGSKTGVFHAMQAARSAMNN
jgi:hypothetical protein